jgi:hypothetical protein
MSLIPENVVLLLSFDFDLLKVLLFCKIAIGWIVTATLPDSETAFCIIIRVYFTLVVALVLDCLLSRVFHLVTLLHLILY